MELDLNNVDFSFEQMDGINFRKANKKDGYNYKKIINDAFDDSLDEGGLDIALKDPSIIIYILEKEGKTVGTATVQLREKLSLAYMYDIAILKEYRSKGLGSYLLQSCTMALKKEGIDKASLSVVGDNNRAIELYRKVGFKEVDTDCIMVKNVE